MGRPVGRAAAIAAAGVVLGAAMWAGVGPDGAPAPAVGAVTDPGSGEIVGEFVYGITPARLLDTRPGSYTADGQYRGMGTLRDEQPITVQIAGRGGVPADATSVLLNVTAVTPDGGGFLAVWPTGAFPGTSNLNFEAGDVVPNMVYTALHDGSLQLMASSGHPHVLIDVAAYLSDQPSRLP